MAARKRMFHTFKEVVSVGEFEEAAVLPVEIDPQMHLSRARMPQPFFLICEKDTVLAIMQGYGVLDLKDSTITSFALKPGDHVYIPGGTPTRVNPDGEMIFYRYKAAAPGREATAWYCIECGTRLVQLAWVVGPSGAQVGYEHNLKRFNTEISLRTCMVCGAVHQPLDLTHYPWVSN